MNPAEGLLSHLIELRNRLLRILVVFLLVFIGMFPYANELYTLLAAPMLSKLPAGGQMIATAVTTPFFIPVKVALLAAFMVSLPHTLYQIWAFVAPGLYEQERRLVVPLVVSSSLLFLIGMVFCYFLVFPVVFGFITSVAPQGVAVMTDIGNYLDFVITLFMAFGVAFEVPIAVVLVVYLDMVTIQTLREIRSYVIVGAFVLGAIFTPPDVISQFMLAMPLWLLYELGIVAAGFIRTRKVQRLKS